MRVPTLILFVAFAAACVAVPAVAQSPAGGLSRFDADGNGSLDAQEWGTARRAMLRRLRGLMIGNFDRNADGELDDDELAQLPLQPAWAIRLQRLVDQHFDNDGDGTFNREEQAGLIEFGNRLEAMAVRWKLAIGDRDGNGTLDATETRDARLQFTISIFRMRDWADIDGDGIMSRAEMHAAALMVTPYLLARIQDSTAAYDRDRNGRLSAEERNAALDDFERWFDEKVRQNDANADGWLGAAEIVAMVKSQLDAWNIPRPHNRN